MLVSLRDIGIRLRNPSESLDSDVPMPTSDSNLSTSSFLISYVLYLSSVSLRQTSTMSTTQAFLRTHTAIGSALTQSLVLCKRVSPERISGRLYAGILFELELSQCGKQMVSCFKEVLMELPRVCSGAGI